MVVDNNQSSSLWTRDLNLVCITVWAELSKRVGIWKKLYNNLNISIFGFLFMQIKQNAMP